ncbi:MAG: 50S ribosomal protein L24 [Patescibacteria group bacterium]|nr:50S ribosomal protein L24 [Patescibacteria group bacterium]
MNIKRGDNIKVIKGKDRGKTGKVSQVFPKQNKVVVEGVNIMIKHLRTRKQGEKGQRLEFNAPLAAANVMLVCPKCAAMTRVGRRSLKVEGGKARQVRVCKKCGEAVE